MPLYEYVCPSGHTTERIGGLSDITAPCLCGQTGYRLSVYHVNMGQKEQKYHVSDFIEASSEIDHAYSEVEKMEGKPVKRPNLYKAGLAEAKRRDPKVKV